MWHCTLWRSAIFRLGGFVPIAVFGFDRAFDHSREFGGVLGPVVASTVVVVVGVVTIVPMEIACSSLTYQWATNQYKVETELVYLDK